uniref:Heterokaryon incompatibility domain-containing protein n=1 Tax=Bionectria ochroleuca TaxID=29856 RepID=A0A0B7KHY6_BIOOC
MTWHRDCRKADITVIDLGLGGLVPCCNSCGEVCPSSDNDATDAERSATRSTLALEPPSRHENLHWPSSVSYFDDDDFLASRRTDASPNSLSQEQRNDGTGASALPCSKPLPRISRFQELGERQIRLLHLSNGNFNDLIHIDLTVEDFAFGVEYEALSYTWANDAGDSQKSCSVYYGKGWEVIRVTENCANALRRLRYRNKTRTLWVDAICINQEDVDERSHQVEMMADIFACAARVIVYLGENEPGSFDDEPLYRTRLRQQVEELCGRPYFSRIWVVQELVFAADKTVICGSTTWDWEMFDTMAGSLPDTTRIPWIRYCSDRKYREGLDLFQLLCSTLNCKSSDPRDRVFALLGLVVGSRAMGLTPDYSLQLADLMIGVTGHFLIHCSAQDSRKNGVSAWASWVPNWADIGQRQWFGAASIRESQEYAGTEEKGWSSHLLLRCVETERPAIGKATGCLKLKGFLVASGPNMNQITFCGVSPLLEASVIYTCTWDQLKGVDIIVVYIPCYGSYFLLRSATTSTDHVAAKSSEICTLGPRRPGFDDITTINPPQLVHDHNVSILANINSWVKALFRSGMYTGAGLSGLVEPWTQLLENKVDYPKETWKRNKLWVRMLLRKAVIYQHTLSLLLKRSNDTGEGQILSRTLSLIRNISLFAQDLTRFVRTGALLDSALTLGIFLWKIAPLRNSPKDSILQYEPSAPYHTENRILFSSFSHFLTNHLVEDEPDDDWGFKRRNTTLVKHFIEFLSSYISLPQNASLCPLNHDSEHSNLSTESSTSEVPINDGEFSLLPRHTIWCLTGRHSITSAYRRQNKRWLSWRDYPDPGVIQCMWVIDDALSTKGWQVFVPDLIDVYIA